MSGLAVASVVSFLSMVGRFFALSLFLLLCALLACGDDGGGSGCVAPSDCAAGERCVNGDCVPRVDSGSGHDAARPDAARGDSGLLCPEGTVDLNGDPEDGCECTVSTNGERCNGADDDCDGSTDEGVSPPVGLCSSTGVCAGTTPSCSGVSGWECNYPSGTYEDPEMSCDSLDNDCDGALDEALTRSCTTACGPGTETCVDGSYQGCTASGSGGAETCNATDDDCDGSVDEDADCGDCTVVPDPSDPAHTYLFCTTTQSWGAAAADCMLKGHHLADLETGAEHGAVWAAAQGVRRDRNWWFGIHYDSADSQWEWTDGTAAYPSDSTAYDGWASDQPDRNTCGFLQQMQGGDWKAGPDCGAMLYYVCEAGD